MQEVIEDMSMPHVCGDEPDDGTMQSKARIVCPTYVGMNRGLIPACICPMSMPHVCGDEPGWCSEKPMKFSYAPRMWG